jgi:23S rRNA (cytidine1920-2'-O)/16S rRNA (cytidine1409-2'-O)-methyltransferase
VRRGFFGSRSAARRAIEDNRVVVSGIAVPRAATLVDEATGLSLVEPARWASRGGEKLAAALDAFVIDPTGLSCLDVGASAGGFTDVLLQRGAAAVAAVDVGYGQLAWRLRQDDRVTVYDRTNFRHAAPESLGAPFDLVVVDVSFISVRLLAGNLAACGRAGSDYVVLVKPQFEVGREHVGRGGIVTDPALHGAAVAGVAGALAGVGIGPRSVFRSPITGSKGNAEFFVAARLGETASLTSRAIEETVA